MVNNSVDVVVIGAGVVGLTVAAELSRRLSTRSRCGCR